ncbi:MAG: Trp biosynthesis-associated membrane protein [Specibacter sp.]
MSTPVPASNESDPEAMGAVAPHSSATKTPLWQRKSTLILLSILAALAVFGTTTQTWIHVAIAPGEVAQTDLDIPGSKAAVSVSALALVALAGALATTIAGKIARIITSSIVLLSAVGIIAVVLGVLANPAGAAMSEVGAATGIIGQDSDAVTTVFPILAVLAAALLALAAAAVLWFGRSWTIRSKYDTATAFPGTGSGEPVDEIDSWDRLSRGEDPTV